MLRRKRTAAIAVAAASALLSFTGVASATSIDKASGGVAVGPLTAPLSGAGLLYGASSTVTCTTGGTGWSILSNGGATPVTQLDQLWLASCSDNLPLINVLNIAVVGTEQVNVTSLGGNLSNWAFASTFSLLLTLNTGSCTYTTTSAPTAQFDDLLSSIGAVNVPLSRTAGSTICPASMQFGANFRQMTDSQASRVIVSP